jgi:hypothetical protein
MPFYFLPSATPAQVRNESDAGVIATLTRKGWQETTPPTPGAGQTPQWDPIAKTWSLASNPPAPPNYGAFEEALKASALMTVNRNRMAPTLTLGTPPTLGEVRTALLTLATANQTIVAWNALTTFLDRLTAFGGDGNRAPMKTRFQNLIWDWTEAAALGAPALTGLQTLLTTHLPSRNYTAQRP